MKKFLIGFLIFALVVLMFPAVASADVRSVEITAPTAYQVSGIVEIKGSIKMGGGQHYYWFSVVDSKGTEIAVSKTVDAYIGGPFAITHSWNWVWDTTLVPNGIYTIKLEATDSAGNKLVAQHEVGVDNVLPDTTAPDVKITAPTTYLVSGIVEIRGSITDDNPHHYWLVVVNSEGLKVAGPGTVNETNSLTDAHLWDWDSTLVPNGIYTIKLEARDVAGNKDSGSVDWLVVEVDNVTTKADILKNSGIPGKGLENAPGLQKPFNPNSQADEHAGMK